MKFLINTRQRFPIPPEASPGIFDASIAWLDKYKGSGKVKEAWKFSGVAGGGGIAEAQSLEELDAIMAEFPLGAFSEIEVLPLVDVKEGWELAKQVTEAMKG